VYAISPYFRVCSSVDGLSEMTSIASANLGETYARLNGSSPLHRYPGPACRLSQGSGERCAVIQKYLNLCLVGYVSERQGFAFSSHGFLSLIRLSNAPFLERGGVDLDLPFPVSRSRFQDLGQPAGSRESRFGRRRKFAFLQFAKFFEICFPGSLADRLKDLVLFNPPTSRSSAVSRKGSITVWIWWSEADCSAMVAACGRRSTTTVVWDFSRFNSALSLSVTHCAAAGNEQAPMLRC